MTNVDTVSTYFASHSVGGGNIVTTGALNSGSITSGFGSIDNGSSAITTTGVITGGTVEATTDTAAGDNAAIGYTSAEGLILTGQGSTSDITFKNDADTTVFSIPTGTDDILFPDNAKVMFGAGSDLQIYHDGSNSYIKDAGTGGTIFLSNSYSFKNAADDEQIILATQDGAVTFYHNGSAKLATTAAGADITGSVTITDADSGEPRILIVDTNADASAAHLDFQKDSASPADNDQVGIIRFISDNDAGQTTIVAQVIANITDVTDGTENGRLGFETMVDGTIAERMTITGEGKVGIGNNAPASTLDVLLAGDGNISGPTSGVWAARVVNEQDSDTYNGLSVQNRWAADSSFILEGAMGFDGSSAGYYPVFTIDGLGQAIFKPQRSEAMRIASDGNVGIGTSSPEAQLHVKNGGGNSISILGQYGTGTKAQIAAYSNQVDISAYNGTNDIMTFTTGGSERMRIRANGQVLINQTSIIGSDNAYLQATGGSVTPVALKGGTNNYFMAFYNTSNTLIGSITGSTGSTTAFNTSSDYRLKENVDYSWDATTRLKQLKPARFNFITDPDNTVDGFIAHEVQEVVPHAVTGEKDGEEMQGIDHSKLVPLLTASLQEALKRIDSLEEQVNALKGK
jgi:hypothetical protein